MLGSAMEGVERELRRGSVPSPENLADQALATVQAVAKRTPPYTTDLRELEALSDANAKLVAARSLEVGADYPREVAADALVPLANLFGSLGREHDAKGEQEAALNSYVLGLRVLLNLALHRPWYSVDKIAFWLLARTSDVVGTLAADRDLSATEMLRNYEENLASFDSLLGNGDPKSPRAFALLAYARRAMTIHVAASEVEQLTNDLKALAPTVEPANERARTRFQSELGTVFSQLELMPHLAPGGAFRWQRADPNGSGVTTSRAEVYGG